MGPPLPGPSGASPIPLYEYEPADGPCDRCGGRFTLLRDVSAPPLAECPGCLRPVRKLLSAPGNLGSGPWSETRLRPKALADAGIGVARLNCDGQPEISGQIQQKP